MALTVKHLNTDASFLLSFEPVIANPAPGICPEPFRILIDPWITGASKIFHSKISITTHKEPACVSSLQELPEPDLVIISQHKSDHCNEATLRQLPPSGTKTIILAEPASARLIRSWRHFERDKVRTIPRWEDPRLTGRQTITRVRVPPIVPGGEPGDVTIAFIPQRRDISGLHGAIGITYRPPPTQGIASISARKPSLTHAATPIGSAALLTPPPTPKSHKSYSQLSSLFSSHQLSTLKPSSRQASGNSQYRAQSPEFQLTIPPTPASPDLSLRSVRSVSSLPLTQVLSSSSPHALDRTLSVVFSPHGISYASLAAYATSHLVAEAALPLTALLHCFDAVSNPWWLGGNVLLGAPAGTETATKLGARAWISAHDGEKDVRGLATGLLRTRKWAREEVESVVSPRKGHFSPAQESKVGNKGTEVLALGSGEEVVLTSEGVWNVDQKQNDERMKAQTLAAMGLSPTIEARDMEPRNLGEVMAMV